jgi:ribosome maturation factor RimP
MNEITNKVIEIIKPILDLEQIYLVDLEFRGQGKNRVLSVYVDTDQGITLSQIAKLNNEISDQLDMHDVIPGAYRLDVSSPGLDRPLKHLWQYRKNIDRYVQVNYQEEDKQKEVTGKLINADEKQITLKLKKDEFKIPFSAIRKVKVKVSV